MIKYNTIFFGIKYYFSSQKQTKSHIYQSSQVSDNMVAVSDGKPPEAVVFTRKSHARYHSPQKKSSNTTSISTINPFLCSSTLLPTTYIPQIASHYQKPSTTIYKFTAILLSMFLSLYLCSSHSLAYLLVLSIHEQHVAAVSHFHRKSFC